MGDLKIYFVRPKPEESWIDMPVFLVKAVSKAEVLDILRKEDGQTESSIEYLKEYYEILSIDELYGADKKVIWGESEIKK